MSTSTIRVAGFGQESQEPFGPVTFGVNPDLMARFSLAAVTRGRGRNVIAWRFTGGPLKQLRTDGTLFVHRTELRYSGLLMPGRMAGEWPEWPPSAGKLAAYLISQERS